MMRTENLRRLKNNIQKLKKILFLTRVSQKRRLSRFLFFTLIVSFFFFQSFVIRVVNAGSLGSLVSITNSDFETGNTTGWTTTVSTWVTGISGTATADNTTSSGGTYSAKITLTNSDVSYQNGYARITQNITLTGNTYYQFSVDTKNDSNSAFYLDLSNSDSTLLKRLIKVTDENNSDWKTIKFNFKTPADTQTWTLNFRAQGVAAGVTTNLWIDNVVIRVIDSLDKNEFTVGAIGDSQVQHLGLFANMENDSTGSWLSSSIRKAQLDYLIVAPPLNKGVSGNRAYQVDDRIQTDIIDSVPQPEIVYIAVGTNDAAGSVDTTSFKNSITSILQKLKNANIRPVLFKITPRKDSINITPYNTAISDAASEQNVILFDPTPLFDANPTWQTDWMDDNVHYNSSAHLAIGKSLGSYLKDFIASPSAFTPTANTSSTTNNTTPQISFSTTDNVGIDHYTVQVDSGSESTQTSPYTLPVQTEGSHTITIRAYDALWNTTQGTVVSLTVDTTAPTISAVSAGTPTLTGATITWTTNEDSSSKVDYGLTNSYGSTTSETDTSPRVTSHSVALSSLSSCTTYHYRVRSIDTALNETIDSDNTFITAGCTSSSTSSSNNSSSTSTSVCSDTAPGAKAPWLYGAIAQDSGSVLLYFTEADNPVNKYVLEYGTRSSDYPYGVQDMGINSRGQMTFLVKSLSPNTTYYFRVRGGNGCATGSWSNEISEKTKPVISFNQLDITSELNAEDLDERQDQSKQDDLSNNMQEGYKLKIKVVDSDKQPVSGAKVTIHSKVQEAKTNEEGFVEFTNVEPGEHKVLIAYNNYQGEQSLNLTGDAKGFDLRITIEQRSNIPVMYTHVIIAILILTVLALTVLLIRAKRKEVK